MVYIPNTDADRSKMLNLIGVQHFDELLSPIPEKLRFKGTLQIPSALSELEVVKLMNHLSRLNCPVENVVSFLGGGSYDHYIPAVVGEILSRPEYYTSYTPYQAEVSQGTLQTIYEYQTMIAELTGMEIANASMYDGGSATAEASLMACDRTGRSKVLVAAGLHPWYKRVIQTYCSPQGVTLVSFDDNHGGLSADEATTVLDEQTGGIVVQYPDFFGCVEDYTDLVKRAHSVGALVIAVVDPIALGILSPPGDWGVDIVTAEGQGLGIELNFGGPYLGIFACKKDLIRRLPGRLIGRSVDKQGKQGFVMTLQTREQHIRREKATSNICTNQALMALAATVYMTVMGKQGIREVANLCLQKSHYLADRLRTVPGVSFPFEKPFFKEFTVKLEKDKVKKIAATLPENGFLPGIVLDSFDYPDHLLIAVTEKRTREEMDRFVDVFQKALAL